MALVPASRASLLRDARAETQVRNKLEQSHDPDEFVREIAAEWANLKQNFLRIGHYLVTAKANLPHGDYLKLINERLPFGRNVAHQLAAVYLAVESQTIPLDLLPSSYTTCYQIVRLEPEQRAAAMAEGVIHPRTTARDLTRFVAKRDGKAAPTLTIPSQAPDRDALEAEQQRLDAELARLRQREQQICRRMAEIQTLLR